MAEAAGMNHSKFERKLKVAVGRAKLAIRGNEGKGKRSSKSEREDSGEKRNFGSGSRDTGPGFGKEGSERHVESKKRFKAENSGFKRKRVYGDRDNVEEGDFGNGGASNRKSFSREGKSFSREGRNGKDDSYRERKSFSREGINGKDDSFRERKSFSREGYAKNDSFRERKPFSREGSNGKDDSFGERKSFSREGYARNDSFRERKSFPREGYAKNDSFRERKSFSRDGYAKDDSFRERKSFSREGYAKDDSFRERKSFSREGSNAKDDSFRERKSFSREGSNAKSDSFRERKSFSREGSHSKDDSFGDRKPYSREGTFDKDDSFGERKSGNRKSDDSGELYENKKMYSDRGRSNDRDGFGKENPRNRELRPSRGDGGNVGSSSGGNRFSDFGMRSKEKTTFKRVSSKPDGREDRSRKEDLKSKVDSTKQVDEKDDEKGRVGSLDIAAKKFLRYKKDQEIHSELKDGPRKGKKTKIRLDPNDISNKRIDDGISINGDKVESKVDEEKDNEMSKNAQFRAIQPSPSILTFVEDNLLGRRRLIDFRRAGYNLDFNAPLDNVPFSTNSDRERIEDPIFRNKLDFFAAAKISSSFPPADLPEIAFAGRSNVGKSSLLNALTRQWGVVRTSDKPGHTQTINFFNLGKKLALVDLPGYGFAYAKEEVKDAWEELVKEYVSTRVGLRQVCLLIDTKWGMKPRDHELISLMERSKTNYQIVLTKTDSVFPMDVARRAMQIEETLKTNRSLVQPVMMVSSKTGAGVRCLRTVLSKISRFAKV